MKFHKIDKMDIYVKDDINLSINNIYHIADQYKFTNNDNKRTYEVSDYYKLKEIIFKNIIFYFKLHNISPYTQQNLLSSIHKLLFIIKDNILSDDFPKLNHILNIIYIAPYDNKNIYIVHYISFNITINNKVYYQDTVPREYYKYNVTYVSSPRYYNVSKDININ